jgi:menaquinone-dependent protoporphyrinogen oxidase
METAIMPGKILVAYATKLGSTREVADRIGEIIKKHNIGADVRKINSIRDINEYSAVILGTPIRMGKPVSETISFLKKFQDQMKSKQVALFSVGLYMKEDTPENREKALKCLDPALEFIRKPISIGLFGGKVDYRTMPVLLRWMFSKDTSGNLAEGDWRNWDSISEWVDEIIPVLFGAGKNK